MPRREMTTLCPLQVKTWRACSHAGGDRFEDPRHNRGIEECDVGFVLEDASRTWESLSCELDRGVAG